MGTQKDLSPYSEELNRFIRFLDAAKQKYESCKVELTRQVHLIYIGLDTVEESLHRIENRVKHGGHNVPRNDVIRRFQNRWDAVSKILPYCDEAEFYDNDQDFVKVAEYRDGELFRIGNHTCSWINELAAYLEI